MLFRGSISGDLNRAANDEILPGIYVYGNRSDILNAPSEVGWGLFLQMGGYSYYYTQVIVDAAVGVKTRKYTGNPAVWATWK